MAFAEWRDWIAETVPEMALLTAIPSGGHRHKAVAAQMKAEGLLRGLPDLFLFAPRNGYHGLAIELKTQTGRVSRDQRQFLARLRNEGYAVVVARGWQQAALAVIEYLSLDRQEFGL